MAKYSTEFKKKIVAEYLKGNIGYGSLAKKYNIPSMNPIATWVAAFQSLGTKGISRSRQKKSYSFQFKLHAVELYLSTEISYKDLALQFEINNPINVKIIMNTFAHIKMYIFNLQQASYGLLIYKTFLKLKLHGNDEGFYPKLHLQQLHHKKYHPMN